jgi:endonuclease/exonuclease/phosphatase family metal-dependent hydrolase
MRLRVATANLHGLQSGEDEIVALLAPVSLDLVLVQECGSRGRFRRLSERLGSERVADPPAVVRRRVKNGLLLRRPWSVTGIEHHRFARSSRWHPRGVVAASLAVDGGAIWALSTHLGLAGAERLRNARELIEIMRERRPFVLGGDLNALEDSRVVGLLGEVAVDVGRNAGATYPAGAPAARIDYLFVSPDIAVGPVEVIGGPRVSDHLILTAEIELPAGASGASTD